MNSYLVMLVIIIKLLQGSLLTNQDSMESRRFFFLAHIPMELSFTTSNFRCRILNKPEPTASLPLKIGRGPQKERRKSSNHQSSVAFAVSFREGIHESVMP